MWRSLDQRFGHSGGGTDIPEDGGVTGRSIEVVLREVLTRKDANDPVVQQILGMTAAANGEFEWPSERSVAEWLKVQRVQIVEVLQRLRERWRDHAKSLTLLRDEISALLHRKGGVIAARELARDVLSLRGSAYTNERDRAANASAVARAAVETEHIIVKPRFALFRFEGIVLVAEDSELAEWAQRLGREADRIAAEDPLLGSSRVLEELQRIKPPASQAVRLAPHDLIALAASASHIAACNTGGEIYPRGMEAVRALKLTRSALTGIDQISDNELRTRVASRYPFAEPLPLHPGLDRLVREAELGFEWNPDANHKHGAYINRQRHVTSTSSGSSSLERSETIPGKVPIAPEELTAAQFEQRLLRALKQGAFLALAVRTADFLNAEKELLRRFSVTKLSIDEVLIRAIKQQAAAAGAQWSVVVRTDAEGSASADWHRLLALVQRAMPDLQSAIEAAGHEATVLLTDLGLIARYEQMR
ncbi:MAG: hypothetical protein JOZ29_09470, partial [Deltaproteobacteria bacterium]|nr:hypothetical protein [Deltaproteobacteria bacterium]